MIHTICTTQDGVEVCVDLINSEAAHNIARQPQLINLVKEVLTGKRLSGANVRFEYNLGRIIGHDFIVETPADHAVFYARVLHDDAYTRFIKSGKPLSTNYVAITLKHNADSQAYEVQDARIGRLAPPRPGMPNETPESKHYWSTHAFVHDGQVLQARTITKECPY